MENAELIEALKMFKDAYEKKILKIVDIDLLKSMKKVNVNSDGTIDLNMVDSGLQAAAGAYYRHSKKKN